nr:MAG TPA: Transcriptional regulator, MarR/EmrR family, emrR, transcriptional regulator, DNA-binding [Caudoviricetes sp.]
MFDDYGTNYPIQPKQFQALVTIANTDGEPMTLDEVLAKLPYETTKQSFQFTLRSLIKRGLVEKLNRSVVNKKSRRVLRITPLGFHKIKTELLRSTKAVDAKTCLVDEIEKTDLLLAKIEKEFAEFY